MPHMPKHLPLPKGDHIVGALDVMTGPMKDGTFLRLYYPIPHCDVTNYNKRWPAWAERTQYVDSYIKIMRWPLFAGRWLANWLIGELKVPVVWQAPILREDGRKFPVVIFSHGLGGNRTTYSYLCMDLASHGFVVAALEHRDQSAGATYFYNKHNMSQVDDSDDEAPLVMEEEWLPYYRPTKEDDEFEIRSDQNIIRANEVKKAYDLLRDLNLGRHILNQCDPSFSTAQFADVLDMQSGCGVMGHSFGAATIIKAMAEDKRFRVGVALDAWMFPLAEECYEHVDQPLLFINSEEFQWKENVLKILKLDTGNEDRKMITIRGTVHQSVSDFSLMIRGVMGKMVKANGSKDPDAVMDINNRSAVAFLWKYLGYKGNDSFWAYIMGNSRDVIMGTNVKLSSGK
ncbi:PREDICTED: platelet-activating factor acetylhydrolase-like isoform X1 [Priapulus caudatus]|uniref:1-alkyl-2-acetylglycerophosphocholine esterase n=1 Tax=Priapulus caudatus TaxID=37621 RepID=A0ABM1DQ93_PRICU|nr:PREDICTED: platelet-activating factor acetylhydrolase-like isoform X1 [Priapulus caudatus]XP_014662115.1 PREDICTED: platelet-activating factor acetylhydrolase-like isoform X1 [Priapulus caudatus]